MCVIPNGMALLIMGGLSFGGHIFSLSTSGIDFAASSHTAGKTMYETFGLMRRRK
jgi:hypothetical protein